MHYTLCDMFSDLAQNSFEAMANTIFVTISIDESNLQFVLTDTGKGMNEDELKKATDPFFTDGIKHPNRKIGLGLPFLVQTTEETGGSWKIKSRTAEMAEKEGKSVGTTIEANFNLASIDTPPIGNLCSFFCQILTFDGKYEMILSLKTHKMSSPIEIKRSEILEALDLQDIGVFTDASSMMLLSTYIESLMEDYNG